MDELISLGAGLAAPEELRGVLGGRGWRLISNSTEDANVRVRTSFSRRFSRRRHMTTLDEAGGENLGRLKSRLRRSPQALNALRTLGINAATADRLHLGLKEPYRSRVDGLEVADALCFPLLGEGLRALGRYAYLNLAGVTSNPPRPTSWGPGSPQVYRLGSFAPNCDVLVAAEPLDCWLAWQLAAGAHPGLAFMSRSHAEGWPAEWRSKEFWSGFRRIILVPGTGCRELEQQLAPHVGRAVESLQLPAPFGSLTEMLASPSPPSLEDVLAGAQQQVLNLPRPAAEIPPGALGRFEAAPVRITGAFVGGHSYYPFPVESRELEESERARASRIVHVYSTMILRSDGHLLTTEVLPAPRGTPTDQRILALSDGTRILSEPMVSRTGTWSFASIQRFVRWRQKGGSAPFRSLEEIIEDVEAHMADRVWLPVKGQTLLAALYVVLSHVYQVFDAIPLLLVKGPRGTGKSELGEAIARLSFNATIAGQLRAAGMIRLLDETRGLIVLDDMDGDGPTAVTGNGELAQALKTSYKRSTSLKPVADRGGRVRMVDFYGPKVIGNTRGVDAVMGSRMVAILTAKRPSRGQDPAALRNESALDELRDELHSWAMANSGGLHRVYCALPRLRVDRRGEITAPLIAIASMAGKALPARLSAILADPRTYPERRTAD
ncbi:DUF3631 domain-containing protein [Sphingomonas parva]|uniref:DUF3631 domain-containing protein n=1 Tax=Sphingomonas parva TaxID=2555898 RepID=A0A4Y8ZYP3_9SPHN|nr:DUF3631 domain-containing protein [Sphingomonas parva]TFI59756.1 DUF3631 domain-containing protein [Sphingomonas parva]